MDCLVTDPQIRLFLEVAHSALENAGYDPYGIDGTVSVYASAGTNRYVDLYLGDGRDSSSSSSMAVSALNNTDYVASTVAYKLNLTGAAITLSTACSSSLVGLHLASQAIRNGECDVAVVGGVDIEYPVGHGYVFDDGGPVSRSGHVRPFGADADGTVFSSGAGAVVVKALADAVADGDHVWAVIRGSAVNNDGASKAGFTAPSITGQAAMLTEALAMAEVAPADLDYVEAHATGTVLGDPVELAALEKAFRALSDDEPVPAACGLGSVKGNLGHLGHAAGIASLIKVALCLDRDELVPSINADVVNPHIDPATSPFRLVDRTRPWPRRPDRLRVAGVSSFGVGGTNAHVVLAEAPSPGPASAPTDGALQVLTWSGRTAEAADAYGPKLGAYVRWRGTQLGLDSVAGTLQTSRTRHPHRRALVADDLAAAATPLEQGDGIRRGSGPAAPLLFAFPGQGAQHAAMATGLHGRLPVFTAAFDECLDLLAGHGLDVADAWRHGTDADLVDTALAQPLLFAVEVALARQWESWGVRPAAVCAHSVGEMAALVVTGICDLSDGVRMLAARVAACVAAPAGRMLAVAATPDQVGTLPYGVSVAVVNGPRQTVLGGPADAIAETAERLAARSVATRLLATSRAFHTPAMAGAAEQFALAVEDVAFKPPQLPLFSGAAGGRLDDASATDPRFWAEQLSSPVRFDRLVEALGEEPRHVVEVGPGRTLTGLLKGRESSRSWPAQTSLPAADRPDTAVAHLTGTFAELWVAGQPVNFSALAGGRPWSKVSLPSYPYQRSRHWVDRPAALPTAEVVGPVPTLPAEDGPVTTAVPVTEPDAAQPMPANPFSTLVWRRDDRPPARVDAPVGARGTAVVLAPADPDRRRSVIRAVQQAGWQPVLLTEPGSRRIDGVSRPARPDSASDLGQVLDECEADRGPVQLVVNALGLDPAEPRSGGPEPMPRSARSVIAAVRAIVHRARPPRLLVLSARSVDVTGSEPVEPDQALLHGLVRSVAAEHPEIGGRLIDVGPHTPDAALAAQLVQASDADVVALRGPSTWRRVEEPLDLEPTAGTVLDEGVYLITGAFGGLGRALARGLAGTGRSPRLVLVGRHLPSADDPFADELRALGAETRLVPADVTDPRAVRRAFDIAAAAYGRVDGVFHLAGVAGNGLLAFRTDADIAAVLGPKVAGTEAVAAECAARQVDRLVVFSSRAAADGLVGSADYAGANAYADAVVLDRQRHGLKALSVGWPSWSGAGMAVAGDDRLSPWVVEVDQSWPVVDEHRLDGIAVMPGTGHLDLVVRAARERLPLPAHTPLDLRDVVYEAVLMVRTPRRLEVWFTPVGTQWHFAVWSRPVSGNAGAVRHVSGRISGLEGGEPTPVDLEAVRTALPDVHPEEDASQVRLFSLGPRWQTVEAIRTGGPVGQKLVELALPDAYTAECAVHQLHPTLLDSATATVRDADELPHLPFLVERLIVHGPLPARLVSHIRRRTSAEGLIVADVDLIDPSGRVLAQAFGYTMRQVTGAGIVAAEPTGSPLDDPDQGIPPAEGVDQLLRLLPLAGTVPYVLVRPHRAGRPVALEQPGGATGTAPPTPARVRVPPPGPTPVAPIRPRSTPAGLSAAPEPRPDEDVAAAVRAIWVEAIGGDTIGPDEDFFALGGNSLTAVGLMARVRERFGVEMSIAALFDHPTIARLAEAVVEQRGVAS